MSKNLDKYLHKDMDKKAGLAHVDHRTKIVATVGPALLTVIVNVTALPTSGAPLLTVLVRLRSATATGTGVTVSSSSSSGGVAPGVESGSNWSAAVTQAVLA